MTEQVHKAHSVLFVDDGVNILRAIKREMLHAEFNVFLAESGQRALEIMREHRIHVVVSDMNMPNMDGAQLLEQVANLYPDTYRVILTGYSDFDATIKAVNEGKLNRYLQKPWQKNELMKVIEEGLQLIRLKDENARLLNITKQQNIRLEQTVQKRTKQIKAALGRIKREQKALEQVLFNVISINPHLNGKFAIEVSSLAGKIAHRLELPQEQVESVTYAALICELGLLGAKPRDFTPPFNALTHKQQREYFAQTERAATMLAPASHLQPVIEMLEMQFEMVNGNGPQHVKGNNIPIGARIIAVARDYWRLVGGRYNGEKFTSAEAKHEIEKFKNVRYDPVICEQLLQIKDIDSRRRVDDSIGIDELQPDMVLQENLYSINHILILPAGHVFSTDSITKMRHYEQRHDQELRFIVDRDDAELQLF